MSQPCCDVLGVFGSNLTMVNQHPTCRNTSQHGGQTHATCCAQQCCDMLRWHVAIVWRMIVNDSWNYHQLSSTIMTVSTLAITKMHASAESVLKSVHRKSMLRKIARTGNKICGKHLYLARKFAR